MIISFIRGFFGGIFILASIISLILGAFLLAIFLFVIGIIILPFSFANHKNTDIQILNDDFDNDKSKSISQSKSKEKEKKERISKIIESFELSDKSKKAGVFYKLNYIKLYVPDYQYKHFDDIFYFHSYKKNEGDWVNKGEIVCYVYSDGFDRKFSIDSTNSGYLEYICKPGEIMSDGQIVSKIHSEGKYTNQNSPNNQNYYHYNSFSDSIYGTEIKWKVFDGDFVKKENEIYIRNSFNQDSLTQKAEKDGFIDINLLGNYGSYKEKDLLYVLRDDDTIRIESKYRNFSKIVLDEFTNSKIIKWDRVSTLDDYSKGVFSKSDDNNIDLVFSFNYIKDKDYIIFYIDPKQLKIKLNDKISFLFENDKKIEFIITEKPIIQKKNNRERETELKSLITKSELELFSTVNFKKWKIELIDEKKEILGGEIGNENYYLTKLNLVTVTKRFANDYIDLVNKEILDYKPLEFIDESKNEMKNEKCFVYLMYDTTNNFYKIGISNKPEYREKTLQSEKPSIELITSKKFPIRKIAESFEKALHETYSDKRIRGEWFKLTENDIQNIKDSLK